MENRRWDFDRCALLGLGCEVSTLGRVGTTTIVNNFCLVKYKCTSKS